MQKVTLNKPVTVDKSEDKPRSQQRMVRLQGVRVKMKNRRVYAALGNDGMVWLRLVRLEGKKQKVTSLRLTTEAAAATRSAIVAVLNEAMQSGTGKQPNEKLTQDARQ